MAYSPSTRPAIAPPCNRKKFAVLLGDEEGEVPTDIRAAVLRMAVKNDGTPSTFERLVALHNATTDSSLQRDIYSALASVPPSLHVRALDWCLTADVRAQDLYWIPMGMAKSGKDGAEAVFAWVKDNYDGSIRRRLGNASIVVFSRLVGVSGAGFVSAAKAEEVRRFWEGKPIYRLVKKTVDQVCEEIAANAIFVERLAASELGLAAYWDAR